MNFKLITKHDYKIFIGPIERADYHESLLQGHNINE